MLALRDVADDGERPDDLSVRIAQGHLRDRTPCRLAVGPGYGHILGHHRSTGANNLLFLRLGLSGILRVEQVVIRLAKKLGRIAQPTPGV